MPAKNQTDTQAARAAAAQQALELLADRWTFLIIREAYFGVHRYGQLQRNLGIARSVLADRLAKLVRHEILDRVRYRTEPDWYEYRLTDRGLDLYPAILTFLRWSDTHYGDSSRPVIRARHLACGKQTEPLLVCSECHEPIGARDIEIIE